MLTKVEIDKILMKHRLEPAANDLKIISKWRVFKEMPYAEDIARVYQFLLINRPYSDSLVNIGKLIGLRDDHVSKAIRELESHGWVAVDRETKPYVYSAVNHDS